MAIDAVVLAGSSTGKRLSRLAQSRTKAALRLFGRPMLEYVLEALMDAQGVRSIVVVGAPNLVSMSARVRQAVDRWVPGGDTLSESLRRGLDAVRAHNENNGAGRGPRRSVLAVSCDAPLLRPEVVDAFLDLCAETDADVVYPLVPRDIIKASLRGVRRTYLRLSDGIFTGGNLALVRPPFTDRHFALLDQASLRRKNPTTMAALLGWRSVIGMLTRRLSLKDLEREAANVLDLKVKGLIVPHPEIGFDVDGPLDYLVALHTLAHDGETLSVPTRPT